MPVVPESADMARAFRGSYLDRWLHASKEAIQWQRLRSSSSPTSSGIRLSAIV